MWLKEEILINSRVRKISPKVVNNKDLRLFITYISQGAKEDREGTKKAKPF